MQKNCRLMKDGKFCIQYCGLSLTSTIRTEQTNKFTRQELIQGRQNAVKGMKLYGRMRREYCCNESAKRIRDWSVLLNKRVGFFLLQYIFIHIITINVNLYSTGRYSTHWLQCHRPIVENMDNVVCTDISKFSKKLTFVILVPSYRHLYNRIILLLYFQNRVQIADIWQQA